MLPVRTIKYRHIGVQKFCKTKSILIPTKLIRTLNFLEGKLR